jgi:hypothetical protein
MTTWQRVVYCTRSVAGERFTVIERAHESDAVRRQVEAVPFTEAALKAMLSSVGEPVERIDDLIANARRRAAGDG